MYEKILTFALTIIAVLITIWVVCRRGSDRRTGSGTGSNNRRVREGLDRATDINRQLEEEEQRTRDTLRRAEETNRRTDELLREQDRDIERAAGNAERSQELINKARNILSSAKHTNSNN